MKSINPYNNEVLKEYDTHTKEEVMQGIEKAQKTFLEWRETSFSERSRLMKKAAQVLNDNQEKYAKIISLKWAR